MKKWCVVIGTFLLMMVGYIWEQGQIKEKTYAHYKENRMVKKDSTVVETDARLSYFLMENKRESEKEEEKDNTERMAYLTFDDGPSEVTEQVLETLKEYGVKATFFVVGQAITEDREVYLKRMVEEGHAIGIHTYTHEQKEIYSSAGALIRDVIKTSDKIYEVCGVKSKIYRFPWGSMNGYIKRFKGDIADQLETMKLTYYDWDVSAEDSVGRPTEYSIMRNIKKNLDRYNKPVILLHDSEINELTADLLPKIIELLQEEGYEFDTLLNREEPCQASKSTEGSCCTLE